MIELPSNSENQNEDAPSWYIYGKRLELIAEISKAKDVFYEDLCRNPTNAPKAYEKFYLCILDICQRHNNDVAKYKRSLGYLSRTDNPLDRTIDFVGVVVKRITGENTAILN